MGKQIALHLDCNRQRQNHICRSLIPLGFEMHKVSNLFQAKETLEKSFCRLVLVDFDCTDKNNDIVEFCDFVRKGSNHQIIIALMNKAKIKLEEKLFDIGVNDVVTGVHATARLLFKRISCHLQHCKEPLLQSNTIRLKNTVVDFDRREVWCNGTTRRLPGILADLLKYFIDNPGRAISRDELLTSPIWNDSICSSAEEGGKTFDVTIGKLRKIIEPYPTKPQIIKSVRGIGWKLSLDLTESLNNSTVANNQIERNCYDLKHHTP